MSGEFRRGKQPHKKIWPRQLAALQTLYQRHCDLFPDANQRRARSERLAWASRNVGREIGSFLELNKNEAEKLIGFLKAELGQESGPTRRPGRDLAHAYGTAGRRGESSNEIRMVDAPTLEILNGLLAQFGWTKERLDFFLHSKASPAKSGAIRTLAEANRVIWALKAMLRHAA